jgi:hypothetical protein
MEVSDVIIRSKIKTNRRWLGRCNWLRKVDQKRLRAAVRQDGVLLVSMLVLVRGER